MTITLWIIEAFGWTMQVLIMFLLISARRHNRATYQHLNETISGLSFAISIQSTSIRELQARVHELEETPRSRLHLDGCVGNQDHAGRCWFVKVSDRPQA